MAAPHGTRSGRLLKRGAIFGPTDTLKHRYRAPLCGLKKIRIANLASHEDAENM